MKTRFLAMAAACCMCGSALAQTGDTSISSNFNGTAIGANDWVWFNSVFDVSGLGAGTAHLYFDNQTISYTSGTTTTTLNMPSAAITLTPSSGVASTTFSSGEWQSTISKSGLSGNQWLSGFALQLPSGLPGGTKPVVWSGQMLSDMSGLTVQWQWAAAVYSPFSNNYDSLDVKATDDNHIGPWFNSDHAGTPENFKKDVLGGATGGGGSNYTGSYSGTASVHPGVVPEPSSFAALGLGAVAAIRRRQKSGRPGS